MHPELVGTHQVAQQALLGDPDRDVAERVRARAVVLVADQVGQVLLEHSPGADRARRRNE